MLNIGLNLRLHYKNDSDNSAQNTVIGIQEPTITAAVDSQDCHPLMSLIVVYCLTHFIPGVKCLSCSCSVHTSVFT